MDLPRVDRNPRWIDRCRLSWLIECEQSDQAVEVSQHLVEHVDQVGRGRAARLFQVFFQGVHQGRKVGQSHAAGRSLERVEAPPQLPQRLPGVGVAAEAQHQRLDPLEQVRGVGEKGLADFLIEINLLGQCGYCQCWNDLGRLNLGGRSRRHCEYWRNRIRPNLDGRSHRHRTTRPRADSSPKYRFGRLPHLPGKAGSGPGHRSATRRQHRARGWDRAPRVRARRRGPRLLLPGLRARQGILPRSMWNDRGSSPRCRHRRRHLARRRGQAGSGLRTAPTLSAWFQDRSRDTQTSVKRPMRPRARDRPSILGSRPPSADPGLPL